MKPLIFIFGIAIIIYVFWVTAMWFKAKMKRYDEKRRNNGSFRNRKN